MEALLVFSTSRVRAARTTLDTRTRVPQATVGKHRLCPTNHPRTPGHRRLSAAAHPPTRAARSLTTRSLLTAARRLISHPTAHRATPKPIHPRPMAPLATNHHRTARAMLLLPPSIRTVHPLGSTAMRRHHRRTGVNMVVNPHTVSLSTEPPVPTGSPTAVPLLHSHRVVTTVANNHSTVDTSSITTTKVAVTRDSITRVSLWVRSIVH